MRIAEKAWLSLHKNMWIIVTTIPAES